MNGRVGKRAQGRGGEGRGWRGEGFHERPTRKGGSDSGGGHRARLASGGERQLLTYSRRPRTNRSIKGVMHLYRACKDADRHSAFVVI